MRWGVSGCNGGIVSCGEIWREVASGEGRDGEATAARWGKGQSQKPHAQNRRMGHPAKTPTRYIGAGDIVLGAKLRY
jgi:hypothetical protein